MFRQIMSGQDWQDKLINRLFFNPIVSNTPLCTNLRERVLFFPEASNVKVYTGLLLFLYSISLHGECFHRVCFSHPDHPGAGDDC